MRVVRSPLMKRLIYFLTMGLSLVACRQSVLEDRTACPSLLYFDLFNAGAFGMVDRVHVNAYRYPDRLSLGSDTTTVRALEGRSFFLDIREADAVRGAGVLGFRQCRVEDGVLWKVLPGNSFDSLFRFSFLSVVEPEEFTVPVEFVKEHSCITLQFLNAGDWSPDGESIFPFEVVVRSNTCGLDALTGIPVQGDFACTAREDETGVFRLTLPRQADDQLVMELYGRPGLYPVEGLAHSYNLGGLLREMGGITWQEKNLPDILIGINFKTTDFQVEVIPWEQENIDYEY